MLLALFRTRMRAVLMATAVGLAAPRLARGLRSFGESRRRSGGHSLSWRVPLSAASALEYAAGRQQRRRSRFSLRRR